MLSNLVIENIAVIERAEIDFDFGLGVFTGETGAGKSIIIDAIYAVLGQRTSRDLIRSGSDSAFVSALFTGVSEKVSSQLENLGIECENNEVLIQRKLTADGKNVCRVNGQVATLSMIREIAPLLVNIYGQHDEQALLNVNAHRGFVDSFGMLDSSIESYRDLYKRLKALKKQIKALNMDEEGRERKIELLKYQIDELEKADIKVGEQSELAEKARVYANAGKTLSKLNSAYRAIKGDNSATELLSEAMRDVGSVASQTEQIQKVNSELDDLYYRLENCSEEIRNIISTLDFSEQDMDNIESRLELISKLSAKYGKTEQDMLDYLASAKKELEDLENSYQRAQELSYEYEKLRAETEKFAHRLSADREGAGKLMCQKIKKELEFLDMPNVDFYVSNTTGNFTPDGIDNIEFLISTNIGETPKSLSKIASGGELSRIMLAIKNVLVAHDSVDTLIFDEVDAGVSGRAAQKIGLKLQELAGHRQVLCVTHLSQIAAFADFHLLIEKQVREQRTYTTVKPLDFEGRKREIARIMGGMNITELMLKNAEEILLSSNKKWRS